jgi:hypothetical protein
MEKIDQMITPEIRAAVQRFGFNKVAAKMYGVDEINEKTAATIVGTNLMNRLSEWKQVTTGLAALKDLGG